MSLFGKTMENNDLIIIMWEKTSKNEENIKAQVFMNKPVYLQYLN